MSVFEKLKQVADKPSAKKSTAKSIEDSSMVSACEAFVAASKAFKNAEAELENAKAVIYDFMKPFHATNIKEGTPSTTYKLNETLMCIFTDRFGALKDFEIESAKEKLAEAKVPFDRLFKEKVTLELKASVAENEKELEKLINQLGDNLSKFDVIVATVPVKEFDKALAREGVYEQVADIVERARYKPSLKVS